MKRMVLVAALLLPFSFAAVPLVSLFNGPGSPRADSLAVATTADAAAISQQPIAATNLDSGTTPDRLGRQWDAGGGCSSSTVTIEG